MTAEYDVTEEKTEGFNPLFFLLYCERVFTTLFCRYTYAADFIVMRNEIHPWFLCNYAQDEAFIGYSELAVAVKLFCCTADALGAETMILSL